MKKNPNDYENFEKGMIYMKILKKGGKGSKQLHFHISRHIAHLGWETPMFFTLFTLSTYGTVASNCF
jgi:hypothetical protein